MTDQPPPPPGNYPPPPQGGYPPPPQQGGYPPPPQQGGYPPPPQQGGYPPPPQQGGYPPPPQQGGYPPPPQQGGYPPQQQGGYPPPAGPSPALPQEAYTPWFTRVLAWLIDNVPVFIVLGIAYGIAFGTADNQCTTDTYGGYGAYCTSSFGAIGAIMLGLGYIAVLAYWVWNWGYRQGTTGSSIGKGVM
jgi:hypothetical protein